MGTLGLYRRSSQKRSMHRMGGGSITVQTAVFAEKEGVLGNLASGIGASRKHRRVEGGCADYFLDSYSRLISSREKATFPCRAVPGSLSSGYLLRRYASLRRRLRMPAPDISSGVIPPSSCGALPDREIAPICRSMPSSSRLSQLSTTLPSFEKRKTPIPLIATGSPVGAMPLNSP